MDNRKLYSVTFQTQPSSDAPGEARQVIVVGGGLGDAAFVADRERKEGETVSIAEIIQPVIFA